MSNLIRAANQIAALRSATGKARIWFGYAESETEKARIWFGYAESETGKARIWFGYAESDSVGGRG